MDKRIVVAVFRFSLAALLIISLLPGCGGEDEVLGPENGTNCADVTADRDSVRVVISLSRLDSVLVFEQSHVPNNALEYEWGVYVDVDSNSSTGINGWDLHISLSSFKFGGSAEALSVLEGTQHNTWTAQQGSWTWKYGNMVDARILPGTSTIVISGLKAWPELLRLNESDPMYFQTYYYSEQGIVRDSTAVTRGANTVKDEAGDISNSNMDIVCGQVLDALAGP